MAGLAVNAPRLIGAGPHGSFVYRIPISGPRPLSVAIANLPRGLRLDSTKGVIGGETPAAGRYPLEIAVTGNAGRASAQMDLVVGGGLALTPPLGWNSWNCFGPTVDEGHVRAAAHALVDSGLADVGWSYVNIDDGWQGARDSRGVLSPSEKFDDMAALCADVHALGLRIGIYSSPGPVTCAGFVGSAGHEETDARTWAAWGFDYLKYDWCSYAPSGAGMRRAERVAPYRRMRDALDATGRDVVFSICQYGEDAVWEWGASAGGHCWRTTGDITDTWQSMVGIGFAQDGLQGFAGPGGWNDPDMLVVGDVGWGAGLRPSRLTADEQRTHLTLWSLLAAPLLLGCDLTRLDDATRALLTNAEVLAINQDALGIPAHRAWADAAAGIQAWTRPLADGGTAIGVFNLADARHDVRLPWRQVGLRAPVVARDVWDGRDLAPADVVEASLEPHACVLLRTSERDERSAATVR